MSMSQWYQLCISSSLLPSSPLASNLSQQQGLFKWAGSLASGGQTIGTSASASVLPIIVQGWFPLGLTSLISLQSRGLERVFSRRKSEKHQFFCTQPSWWSNSHMLVGQWIIQIHILTVLWLHPYLWFCLDLGIYGLNKDEQNSVLTFKKGPL